MRWLLIASLIFVAVLLSVGAALMVPFIDVAHASFIPSGLMMLFALAAGIALVALRAPSVRRRPLWVILGLAACLVAGTMPAFAQDTTITVGGWFDVFRPYLTEIAGILVAAALGWVLMKVKQYLGLEIEARHREALQSALMNGVNRGLEVLNTAAHDTQVDVRSVVLAEGIRYVERSVPDAVKFFRLDPDRIGDLLEAHFHEKL